METIKVLFPGEPGWTTVCTIPPQDLVLVWRDPTTGETSEHSGMAEFVMAALRRTYEDIQVRCNTKGG